jgi:predicted alpha/beta-fold hydrolase
VLKATASRHLVQPGCSPRLLRRDPTQTEWEQLITPSQEEQKPISPGAKADRPVFHTMDEVVTRATTLDFHPLDPFVASVASGMDARSVSEPRANERENIYLSVKEFYDEPLTVEAGLKNGPDAPMMVILPGIYGGTEGGFSTTFKKIAYERGMNYAVIGNPLNAESLSNEPNHHPGNIEVEAQAAHAVLRRLREKKPDFFDNVTLAGYSYGALLAANVARLDEGLTDESSRLIQGGVVALSPPENLYHSMEELDSLRDRYKTGAGIIAGTALAYKTDLTFLGYERFMESDLAKRGVGSNITEIKIADSYGSRNEMQNMVETVDKNFGHKQLPPTWPEFFKRMRVLDEMTYAQYSDEWFIQDPWMKEKGLTPEQLASNNSYSKALEALEHTPVLTLVSADDYILKSDDVSTFRQVDTSDDDLEYTRVMDHGGHVGLLFNPEVQDFLGDFAFSADKLRKTPTRK